MKKIIAVVGLLGIIAMSAMSASATCGTTGDGCTTLPPPPPIGSCVGPCGGTTDMSGFMFVKMDGSSYGHGDTVQQMSGGSYDLTTKFNVNPNQVVQTVGEINMFGGYQAIKVGPGSAWGGASGLTQWKVSAGSITKPTYNPAVVLPTMPQ